MRDEDIAAALAIAPPADQRVYAPAWLIESHRAPQRLFGRLGERLLAAAPTAPKSRAEVGFDLYHDMVVRHLGSGAVALHAHDPHAPADRRWQTLTFEQLHARASELASVWAAEGVEVGSKLAIVLRFGPACVVALLAGLRLGACISLLEPGGPNYLERRLAALDPAFIASEPFHGPALGDFASLLLKSEPGPTTPIQGSHSYLPNEVCALLYSPLRQPPHVPVPLRCEVAYFGALRDATLIFGLGPGHRLAAPGFDTLQHQPALLFAALLLGATFVHVEHEQVLADPSLLASLELRGVGIDARLGEALLHSSVRRPRWAHVFRNPEEPTDWETWRDLIEQLELVDTPMSNLLLEAASGGALLSSPRRPGKAHLAKLMTVTPAPGRAWCMQDFTGSGQRAAGEVGVFTPLVGVVDGADPADADTGELDQPQHVVLARRRGLEYLYGGTTEPRRSGRVIPVEELLDALADCPFLRGASVASLPAGGSTLEHRFVLIGFCGAEPQELFTRLRAARAEELLRVLGKRLTPALLPDRIELFPGYPRMVDDQVDHGWCRAQYLSGTLARKSRIPVFARLTDLRGALVEAGDH